MPSTHISIPLGITIGLLASFVQSLGLTIQRKSHVLNQRLPMSQQRVEHRRPLWLLGFTVFISSNILGSLVQIASLPVVILAPLGAVSLLWNAFFARFILDDVFSPWMILGTLLIAGGAVLIALFGIVPEPTRSLEDLLELFRRPVFVAYFSLLGVLLLLALLIVHSIEYSIRWKLSTPSPLPLTLPENHPSFTTNVADVPAESAATEHTPLLDRKSPSPPPSLLFSKGPGLLDVDRVRLSRTRLLLAISYSSFSGILSGMCLLFAKSGVELLLLTVRGMNQFLRWEPWMLILGLIVLALLQLWYMHKALILADPTLVCPLAFCFYNLSSIINGMVYFNQFTLIPVTHLILVTVGIIILLGGVWVVSIQSGEGGINVGTWAESNEERVSLGEREEINVASQDGDDSLGGGREEERRETVENEGIWSPTERRRGTMSESTIVVPKLSKSTEPMGLVLGLGLPSALRRPGLVPSTSSTPQPRLPLHQPSRSLSTTCPQTTFDAHPNLHPPSFGGGLIPPSGHSRPLSQVSALGAGFQIGLSPMSPGFTIMPRERKRRISGISLEGDRFMGARRRTVSEGDLRRQIAAAEQEEMNEEGLEDEGSVTTETGGSGSRGKGKGRGTDQGKLGWAWWLGNRE